jgi:putative endonuclease
LSWWLYIIETHKKNLYVGITTDVARRFNEHCDTYYKSTPARGAKFFRSQQPISVVFKYEFKDRSEASRWEYRIKAMTPQQKKTLITQGLSVE